MMPSHLLQITRVGSTSTKQVLMFNKSMVGGNTTNGSTAWYVRTRTYRKINTEHKNGNYGENGVHTHSYRMYSCIYTLK